MSWPAGEIVPVPERGRVSRFFFMHLGTLVAIIVYFVVLGPPPVSPQAVRRALLAGLVAKTGYMLLARWQGESKHFDVGLWLMFALGTVTTWAGVEPAVRLFQRYSGAVLFTTLGLTSIVPLLLGREPFTLYFARRQTPLWQQRTAEFAIMNRVLPVYWSILFFAAAGLCAWRPDDPMFTFVYPNLLVLGLGLPSAAWMPLVWFRLFPPPPPTRVETVVLGMPFVFDRRAAGNVRAVIEFRVRGDEPGVYHLRVARGRCTSHEGAAEAPDVVVDTPGTVWMRIARGELDGGQALADGLYTVDGDIALFTRFPTWFPPRRR